MTDQMLPTEGDPTDHLAVAVDANPVILNRDDDGMALDEYFEGMPSSPIPRDYLSTGEVAAVPVTTRVLVNSIRVAVGECQFFFPADPNRQTLFITYVGQEGGAAQGVALTSEKTSTTFPLSAGLISTLTGAAGTSAIVSPVEVSCHTGAVWLTNTGVSPTQITVTVVTV